MSLKILKSVTSGSETLIADVLIPTASVLTLNASPVTLVAAPGAGKAIIVDEIITSVDYASAAYATNTTIEFRYTNGAGDKVTADNVTTLVATADQQAVTKGIVTELKPVANAVVVAAVPTGDPATGNSDIRVRVKYRIVDFI